MRILSSMVALFMTINSALAFGKIDEKGGYFCEGEGACGSGWVWSEETKECVKVLMS